MAANNTPPQYVFEIVTIEAIKKFISLDVEPAEVAKFFADLMSEQYDTDDLATDILALLEKILIFINSVEITDIDLLLESYVYFACNYEKIGVKRNKKPLFRSILKGQPLDKTRVYKGSKSFVGYTYGMRSTASPLKPETWSVADELEFSQIFDVIRPPLDN